MRSKLMTKLLMAVVLAAIFSTFSPSARADYILGSELHKTRITVNVPWQVPGTTLAAGTYVIRLVETNGSPRTVVQIFNKDETRLLATVIAAPAYRPDRTVEPVFRFSEAEPGSPEPLHTWFYRQSRQGIEFLYFNDR
jgi:hypothetical protein